MKDRYKLQITKKGNQRYFKNDKYHREDGPARIYFLLNRRGFILSYYINGNLIRYRAG